MLFGTILLDISKWYDSYIIKSDKSLQNTSKNGTNLASEVYSVWLLDYSILQIFKRLDLFNFQIYYYHKEVRQKWYVEY